jgi:3-hydroxyacyl-CoA dehydrogenase
VTAGTFEKRGQVALVTVDNPPVNAVSGAVRTFIAKSLSDTLADPRLGAVVLACAGRTFMAGADIAELGTGVAGPSFAELIRLLDAFPLPVVAAIHGTALGGGLELALACHFRIAIKGARIGLPEVKLGIIPGAQGTQRLPRLLGVARALDMITSGEPIDVEAAGRVIDRVVSEDLVGSALAFARTLVRSGAQPRSVRDISISRSDYDPGLFEDARQKAQRSGHFARLRAIDAVEAAATLPFDMGVRRELDLIGECFRHPQSKALRHLFFAERQAGRVPGLPAGASPRRVERVGIVGAGTMGVGIAMSLANAGLPVTLLDTSEEALDRAMAAIASTYVGSVQRGRLGAAEAAARQARVKRANDMGSLADCDLVIEAAFEAMEVKRAIFGALDAVIRPGAILTTNTSYLSVDAIAAATGRPGDVLGLHFFAPANVMRLCEVVRGSQTSADALLTAVQLARRIGKAPVVAGDSPGFIGNRMIQAYGREAALLLLEGALPEQVDAALTGFGMAMGVFRMHDMSGLDIGYRARRNRPPGSSDARIGLVPDRLVEAGRLGLKSRCGYYEYDEGSREPRPSSFTRDLILAASAELGMKRRSIDDAEIIDRCLLALVNEGFALLREGNAYRSGDIDTVYVNGYGFPATLGGPMFWAEHMVGLDRVVQRMREFANAVGDRWWQPDPLLVDRAAPGKRTAHAVA